jgi:hypothetical protein
MTGRSDGDLSGEKAPAASGGAGETPGLSGTSSSEVTPRLDFWLALALSALVIVCAHWRGMANPYAINDDVRQQVYWMQRFLDPELYPKDLLNEYARAYVPSGVESLYRAAAFFAGADWGHAPAAASGTSFLNPVRFSNILTGLLFLAQCLLLFVIGRTLGGRSHAWALASMGWLMPFFLDNISGGLARAFASPLLAWFVLACLKSSRADEHLSRLAQAVCIPYIFLPCAAAGFGEKLLASFRNRKKDKSFSLLGLLAVWVVPLGAAYHNASKPQDGGFGPLVWLSETAGRPEFGPDGRLDLVPLPNPFLDLVYFPFERIGLFLEFGLISGIITLAVLAPIVWYGGRAIDWRALCAKLRPLVWTGAAFLAFYIAARLFAFKLFVPDRYVQYPLNLLYAILLSACLASAVKRAGLGRAACVGLIVMAAGLGALRLKNVALYDYSADAPLYAAVEAATPKNAMLAGHPELMDNVMTFSRRNAHATFELAHPWSRGYWEQLRPRLDAFFETYYATDKARVARFARQTSVDFLLVDESHFTPEFIAKRPFFEPFGNGIKQMAAGRQGNFTLLDENAFPRIPLRPGAFLIDLRPFRQPGAAGQAAPEAATPPPHPQPTAEDPSSPGRG